MMRACTSETQAWPRSRLALLALVPIAICLSSVSMAQSPEAPSAAAPTVAAPAEPAPSAAPATVAAPAAGAPAAPIAPTGSFAGLSKNSDQPIDIESDVLLVHDSQKTATFKGNVKAVQGTTILHSNELEVHYAGGGGESLTAAPGAKPNTVASADPAAGAAQATQPPAAADKSGVALGDNGTKITRIYAKGDVVINSDEDQTTTGDLADYDVPGQTVIVSGNVVLTQGKNVLKGDRLFINLVTGESRFDPGSANSGKPARIKAIFQKQDQSSGEDASNKDKSADEKTGNATPGDGSATSGAEPEAAETASQGQPAPDQRPVKEAPAKPAPAQDDASPWQLVPGNMQ